MWEETLDRSSMPPSWQAKRSELPANSDHSGTGSARLSESIKLKGEISGSGDLHIDGKVEGSIELPGNSVTVGPQGQVRADVSARNLVVLGQLQGKVHVTELANIRATGTLEGELVTARLSVEIGAVLRATIDIAKPEKDVKDSDRISAAEHQPAGSLSKLEAALRS